MKYLTLLSLLFAFNVKAQDELTLADEAIEAPAMNIEGQYKVQEVPVEQVEKKVEIKKPAPRKVTASDRMRAMRAKLEERNRVMIEKKMEQIRYQQELALARQLEQSMNQTLQAIDNIKN